MSYAEPNEYICRKCGEAYILEYKGSTHYCPKCMAGAKDARDEQKFQEARDREL